jgi:hypothetical protein
VTSVTDDQLARSSFTPQPRDGCPGNFELFIAHVIRQNGGYVPDLDALRTTSTAWRLRRADPHGFAERPHEAIAGQDVENAAAAPTSS